MTEKYWKLTPNNIEHRAWARSTCVEEIIVIAESEQEARKRAGVFLDKAYKKENIYEDLIVVRPWEEEELVTVSEIETIPESFPKIRIIFPDDTPQKFS